MRLPIHNFFLDSKIPYRIFFLWLVNRNAVLTKDNLIKRNWQGSACCVFCGNDENINHLFFECSLAKMMWTIMRFAFNIPRNPENVEDLLGPWINRFRGSLKKNMLVGISAILWTIWKLRNKAIFENDKVTDPSVPVHLVANLISDWSVLQTKPHDQRVLQEGARIYNQIAGEIFEKMRWRMHTGRIQD